MNLYAHIRIFQRGQLTLLLIVCVCMGLCSSVRAQQATVPPAGGGAKVPQRAVFICEASDAMAKSGVFDEVKKDLEVVVGKMEPDHQFNIIFYNDVSRPLAAATALLSGYESNKRDAIKFIKSAKTGPVTNAIPALEMAFKQKPEIISFLAGGDFAIPSNFVVLEAIAKLNADKKVKINTVILMTGKDAREDARNKPLIETMAKIAADNGGLFRFVTTDQLHAKKPTTQPATTQPAATKVDVIEVPDSVPDAPPGAAEFLKNNVELVELTAPRSEKAVDLVGDAAAGLTGGVIFVCDASGSMSHLDLFGWFKRNLAKEINDLPATAQFNLVFFLDQKVSKALSPKLLLADATGKAQALKFLGGMEPHRDSNPIPALEIAFKQKPQVIYLLTDGDFANPTNAQVMDAIRKLNQAKAVKVNTVLLTTPLASTDKRTESMSETLKKIAADNGGEFRMAIAADSEDW